MATSRKPSNVSRGKHRESVFDFVIVGSGGGGGTIAWMLAKAGYSIALLEMGGDVKEEVLGKPDLESPYNPASHDEYLARLGRPNPNRRPRGDYNTFRPATDEASVARPFKNGWTGTAFGGGSLFWGTWAFRALPVDFRLATHYREQKIKQTGGRNSVKKSQLDWLRQMNYDVADWPIDYAEMVPFYNVAEAMLAVSGNHEPLLESSSSAPWFDAFKGQSYFGAEFFSTKHLQYMPFPCDRFPLTPVGRLCEKALSTEAWRKKGLKVAPLPSAIVRPGSGEYATREAIARSLAGLDDAGEFWRQSADQLWSDRKRDACTMCGYCGEYICWAHTQSKSSTRATTLEELKGMANADIRLHAKALEIIVDKKSKRGKAVRYIDISHPDSPGSVQMVRGKHIIVSCGAVQSARLLFLSESTSPTCSGGLGNSSDQLGRNATFHLFGLSVKGIVKKDLSGIKEGGTGLLHGEYGHTGNVTTMWPYFVQDDDKNWVKAGTLTSTAKKNPLENAVEMVERIDKNKIGADLISEIENYNRTVEMRLTGDDLPMPNNRVDLDPRYVDEYGVPVARITRSLGAAEWKMFRTLEPQLLSVFKDAWTSDDAKKQVFDPKDIKVSPAIPTLIGDHQMGTCRMGDRPEKSVVDRYCRLWEAPNVFVVDSSFMPTGLGLNPMVTVMANALRVGTWIVNELRAGRRIDT